MALAGFEPGSASSGATLEQTVLLNILFWGCQWRDGTKGHYSVQGDGAGMGSNPAVAKKNLTVDICGGNQDMGCRMVTHSPKICPKVRKAPEKWIECI